MKLIAIFPLLGLLASLPAYSLTELPDPVITNFAQKETCCDSFPSNVFDNNNSTVYASNDKGVDTFLDFDFLAPTVITGFRMTQRDDIARVLNSNLIFDDDSNFSSPLALVGLSHTNAPLASDLFEFNTPISARYVRWDVTQVNHNYFLSNGAAEMTFYGVDPVPAPAALPIIPVIAARLKSLRRLRRWGAHVHSKNL